MRILNPGAAASDRLYRTTCHHCGTGIEFRQGEAELVKDPRSGDSYLKLRCPFCPRFISVEPRPLEQRRDDPPTPN
jgi:hypothetical protein